MSMEIPQAEIDHQMSHLHESRQGGLIGFYVVTLVLAIAMVVCRFASRKWTGAGLGMDDWTIALALIFYCGVWTINFLYIAAGLGHHALANTKSQQALATNIGFPSNILYTITWPLIKISILLLYCRIFFVNRRFTTFVYIFIGALCCYIVSTVLVDVFSCIPVDKSWHPMKDGHCLDSTKLFKVTAGLNVAFDVIILLCPLPLVWALQASVRFKLLVSLIFMLGGLTCVTSIMRIVTFDQINHFDGTWSYVIPDYWTASELCLSIVCACLPTIRPLFNISREFIRSRLSSRSFPSGGHIAKEVSSDHSSADSPYEKNIAMAKFPEKRQRSKSGKSSPTTDEFTRHEETKEHEISYPAGERTRRDQLEQMKERSDKV